MIEHWEMPVGFASPYHTHHREDECFYVLEGKVAFVCGGEWLEAGPGAFVYGPRDIAHGFKAIGTEEAIMLNLPTEPYRYDSPDEYRVDPHSPSVPYSWGLKEK